MDLAFVPIPVLFIITVLSAVSANTVRANYVKKAKPSSSVVFFYNGVLCLTALIVLLAFSGFKVQLSSFTLVLASIYGAAVMISMISNTLALRVGPYSYTTVIISLSTVITALSGWMFWDEKLSIYKILGLVFMVFCFFFAVDKKNDKNSANVKWFLLCMVCLVAGATLGLVQKTHQKSDFKSEITGFLTIAFCISITFSFIGSFLLKKLQKEHKESDEEVEEKVSPTVKEKNYVAKFFFISSIVTGFGVSINNIINLFLAGAVDSSVMFPIVNGVPFVMAVLISFLFFKEKLTKRQTVGIIIGIIAMIFLCL